MRWYHWLGLLVMLAVIGVPVRYLFHGPHMEIQPHIRAYQAVLPAMPAGTVPISSPLPRVPSTRQAQELRNPLPATSVNLQRGRVYYIYYCIFCHGDKGDGTGPVGDSYVPRPADLRDSRVQNLADGPLMRAMLTGAGHEPVLGRIVPQEHYWHLVLFVRHLASSSSGAPAAETRGQSSPTESNRPTGTTPSGTPGQQG